MSKGVLGLRLRRQYLLIFIHLLSNRDSPLYTLAGDSAFLRWAFHFPWGIHFGYMSAHILTPNWAIFSPSGKEFHLSQNSLEVWLVNAYKEPVANIGGGLVERKPQDLLMEPLRGSDNCDVSQCLVFSIKKVLVFKWAPNSPQSYPTSSFPCSVSCLLWHMKPNVGQVLTGWWQYAAINKVHLMCHLLFLEYILVAPRCSQGRLWHCSQIHRIHGYLKVLETCWKFMEKFRGVVGLVKVEVESYGQHANLNPTILSCNEGLEVLLIFRIYV